MELSLALRAKGAIADGLRAGGILVFDCFIGQPILGSAHAINAVVRVAEQGEDLGGTVRRKQA